MTRARTTLPITVALVAALMLTIVALTGCGGTAASTPLPGPTAKTVLPAARSAMATLAPDAKLLLVQTAEPVTPTATPVWAFLFGSPKSDKTYVVYVAKGKASPASTYGAAGLTKAEWAAVPAADAWKIDSDAAYATAFSTAGGHGNPAAYGMGFVTFVPKSAGTAAVKSFVWNVNFEPGSSGATTATIYVDAKTGAASKTK